jgi:hypothetical protein
MDVECIYISEQVLRFKITGGSKEMFMEKILKKNQPLENNKNEF